MSEPKRRTYGGLHKATKTFLFGVSRPVFFTLASCFGVGIVLMLLQQFLLGGAVLALVVLVWVPLATQFGGQSGYEYLASVRGWRTAKRKGRNVLRAGTISQAPQGRTRLPGIGAATEMWWGTDRLGRRFGMIHLPATHQYTVLLRCSIPGFAGVEQERIDLDVSAWGEYINAAGQATDIDAVVTVLDSVPETGDRQLAEIAQLSAADAPVLARAVVAESATTTSLGIQLHGYMSITFRADTAAKRKDPMVMLTELAGRVPAMCENAGTFRVQAVPMSDYEAAAVVRRAYDPRPAVESAVEQGLRDGEHLLDWVDAGPLAAEETKDSYFHDSAVSRTWVMNQPPSGVSTERVLARLLTPNADVPRKRVTLIHRPLSPADAAIAVETGYTAARGELNTERGIPGVRAELKVSAAERTRREEAEGAGVTQVSLLVTVTANDQRELDEQSESVIALGASSRIMLRPAWRQQAAAFLAGLGVGVLLPDHATTAKALRAYGT